MKKIIALLLSCVMIFCCVSAFGEEAVKLTGNVYTTADNSLSIQAPTEEWLPLQDATHWFALSNGKDLITFTRSNIGDPLPAVITAGGQYAAVCQSFLSLRNQIICVSGLAKEEAGLRPIMAAIATITLLNPAAILEPVTAAPTAAPAAPTAAPAKPAGSSSTGNWFNVYAKDGSVASIHLDTAKLNYYDANGRVFTNLRGDLYYCIENSKEYHADPNYWGGTSVAEKSAQAAAEPFMVYPLRGADVTIWKTANGYTDGTNTYYQTANGLYVCNETGVAYSADPDYWNYDDAEIEDQEKESNEAAAQPFTVYPLRGADVTIWITANGYTDGTNTYSQTPQALYVCNETGVTYSADPDYWNYDDAEIEDQENQTESTDTDSYTDNTDADSYVDDNDVENTDSDSYVENTDSGDNFDDYADSGKSTENTND